MELKLLKGRKIRLKYVLSEKREGGGREGGREWYGRE
jgi:hypothetical protein